MPQGTTKSAQRIALIFAMEAEARPLIDALGLVEDGAFGDSALPFRHFRGPLPRYPEVEILLSLNGQDVRFGVDNIGTEPATLNAYITMSRFKPHLCINAGTAGGFSKRGGAIGDVYISHQPFRFHDRRIPLPGFEAYGVGSYPFADFSGNLSKVAFQLGLKEGVITTGNSLDHTDRCLEIIDQNEGAAKEMEAAAIAWVAWMIKVPFVALKSITDIVDGAHPTSEEFLRNLSHASLKLQEKTLAFLNHLASSNTTGQ